MSKESDLALAAALRQIADTLVMSAAARAGIPPGVAPYAPGIVEKAALKSAPKAKRKISKYQREFGRTLKALKKKHPRTKVQNLMKRAHRETKRRMK